MKASSTIETIRGKLMQTVTIQYLDTDKRAPDTIAKMEKLGYKLISESEHRWGVKFSIYREIWQALQGQALRAFLD